MTDLPRRRRDHALHFAVMWLTPDPDDPPERRLWLAVLRQSVLDLADDMHRAAVIRWLGTDDFDRVCALADVEAECFRRLLSRTGLS